MAPAKKLGPKERWLSELPLLPGSIAKLLSLDSKDPHFFREVLQFAQADPGLGVRLIKLANSGAMAPATPITKLRDAIARVGVRHIVNFVSSATMLKVFVPSTRGQRYLWHHSIETAVIARAIAKARPALEVDPDQAYLCGLVHDIGRFVLFMNDPDELEQIDNIGWSTPPELREAEEAAGSENHALIGMQACVKWRLPRALEQTVGLHHSYELPRRVIFDRPLAMQIRIIQIADLLSMVVLRDPEIRDLEKEALTELIAERCYPGVWKRPPISPVMLAGLVQSAHAEARMLGQLLGVRVDEPLRDG